MTDFYPILAIETSGELCSICIQINEEKFAEISLMMKHIHSQLLIPSLNNLLSTIGLRIEAIKTIVISEGPGSFTGLRIGYSVVKGLALGNNIPVYEIPTFLAAALKVSERTEDGTQVCIVSKVNNDELYYASFQKAENTLNIIEELKIVESDFIKNNSEKNIFSLNQKIDNFKQINLESRYIAKWFIKNRENIELKNIDFIEPKYFKDFIVR